MLGCQFKETVCDEAATALPDTPICNGELVALLAIDTLPVIVPLADVGSKLTVRVAD